MTSRPFRYLLRADACDDDLGEEEGMKCKHCGEEIVSDGDGAVIHADGWYECFTYPPMRAEPFRQPGQDDRLE